MILLVLPLKVPHHQDGLEDRPPNKGILWTTAEDTTRLETSQSCRRDHTALAWSRDVQSLFWEPAMAINPGFETKD
jgi:hypothetical protein